MHTSSLHGPLFSFAEASSRRWGSAHSLAPRAVLLHDLDVSYIRFQAHAPGLKDFCRSTSFIHREMPATIALAEAATSFSSVPSISHDLDQDLLTDGVPDDLDFVWDVLVVFRSPEPATVIAKLEAQNDNGAGGTPRFLT